MAATLLLLTLLLSTPIQAVQVATPELIANGLHTRIEFQPDEFFPDLHLEVAMECTGGTYVGTVTPRGFVTDDAGGRIGAVQVGGGLASN